MKRIFSLLLVAVVTAETIPEQYLNMSDCTLWHHRPSHNSTDCVCGADWDWLILCYNGQIFLRDNFLLGIKDEDTPHSAVVAESWFVSLDSSSVSRKFRGYYLLPDTSNKTELNDILCSRNNRKGFLCGECLPNYGPNAHHPMCSKCHLPMLLALALYLVTKIAPILFWFVLIMTFRFKILRGPLMGYFTFCQLYVFVVREHSSFRHTLQEPWRSLESFSFCVACLWNLDFFHTTHLVPPFCISPQLRNCDVLLLNFISALTPLLLAVSTVFISELGGRYCNLRCWMPVRRCFALVRVSGATNSLVHAYASLYILTFSLLNYNTYKFLKVTNLFGQEHIIKRNVLIMHPTLKSYSSDMIVYIIAVTAIFFFLGIIPSLLLVLYPTKVTLRKCFSPRCLIVLNTFVEAFQGPFKNGCNGTRDFRIVPGVVGCLVLALTMFSCIQHVVSHDSCYVLLGLSACLGISSVLCAYARPCKSSIANVSLVFHCMWMAGYAMIIALWNIALSVDSKVLMVLLGTCSPLPHIMMALWMLYVLGKGFQRRFSARFKFVIGKRLFGNRVDTDNFPDRLINSQRYRELR